MSRFELYKEVERFLKKHERKIRFRFFLERLKRRFRKWR